MSDQLGWPTIVNEELVERLIPAVQRAIVDQIPPNDDGMHELSAPDVANVFLMQLAVILECTPGCRTAQGMRETAQAAGKELLELMRDTRRLRAAEAAPSGTLQ